MEETLSLVHTVRPAAPEANAPGTRHRSSFCSMASALLNGRWAPLRPRSIHGLWSSACVLPLLSKLGF